MIRTYLFAGICIVSETTEEELRLAEGERPELTQGVTVAYTKPAPTTQVYIYIYSTSPLYQYSVKDQK